MSTYNRRMFTSTILCADGFLSLSYEEMVTYFYMCMGADDEGIVDAPKRILRTIGANETALDGLVKAGYLYRFESGRYIIRHWFIHNYLKGDRKKESIYRDDIKTVVKDNGEYFLRSEHPCIQSGSKMEPQNSIDKNSKDKNIEDKPKSSSKTYKKKENQFNQMMHTEYDFDAIEKMLLSKPV